MQSDRSELAQVRARPSVVHIWRKPKLLLQVAYTANALLVTVLTVQIAFIQSARVSPDSVGLTVIIWAFLSPYVIGEFRKAGFRFGWLILVVPPVTIIGAAMVANLMLNSGASGGIAPAGIILLGIVLVNIGALIQLCRLITAASTPPSTVLGCGKQHHAIEGGE